jgi:hypothetical protein
LVTLDVTALHVGDVVVIAVGICEVDGINVGCVGAGRSIVHNPL